MLSKCTTSGSKSLPLVARTRKKARAGYPGRYVAQI